MVALVTVFAFEGIATATAMPVVAEDLGLLESYTWAFSAYFVASLLAIVVGGLWSDAEGPRRPIIAGGVTLAVGSVVAGLANGLVVLIVGRSLQGFGGGILIVGLYVLIARAFDVDTRPKAFSVLAAAWVVPSLVGPVVAGWLAESVSWRAVFLLVPLVLLLPALLLFPRLREYDGGTRPAGVRGRLTAAVIAALALLALQGGLLEVSWPGAVLAAVGFAVMVAAVRRLLPAGSMRLRRGLPSSVMMRGFLAGAFASAEVFVPLALTQIRGLTVTQAGLILATSALLWSVGSYVQGRLPGEDDRAGAVRLGAGLVTVGLLSLPLSLLAALPPWVAVFSWAVTAFGMGLAVPSVSVQVMRLSAPEALGANSSAIQVVDALGVTVAVSIAGFGHAFAVVMGGATAGTYLMLWVGSALLGLLAVVFAGRMTPTSVRGVRGV